MTRMMTLAATTTISLKCHNILYLPGSMTIVTTIIPQMFRLHHRLLTLPTISFLLPLDHQTPLTSILINHTTKTCRHNTGRHHKTTHLMRLLQTLSLISNLTLALVRAASHPLPLSTLLLTTKTLNLTILPHIPHMRLLPQASPPYSLSKGRNNSAPVLDPAPSPAQKYHYDSSYKPGPEKIAEAHKAARFAVGALAFDEVSTAVEHLKKSLELLTVPSGGH